MDLLAPRIQSRLTLPVSRESYVEHLGKYEMAPLLAYLDADKDGTVSIQEFYDVKAVHILKMLFDGLDVNKDGLVKQREARLESFLRPTFLRTIIQEIFDFLDANNDNEISDGEYQVRCLERYCYCRYCHLLYPRLEQVCESLMRAIYFSPEFDM